VAHDEVYLVVQSIQASNQSIDGEFADAAGDKRGNIRLLQRAWQQPWSELPTLDDATAFANQPGLEKFFLRIGKTKVCEDVAVDS
jgi:hypothetical protein